MFATLGADSTGTMQELEKNVHLQNKLLFRENIHNVNCGFLLHDISIAAKEFSYKEFVPAETIECLRRNP